MSILNAYWVPPADQNFAVRQQNSKKSDLGFRHDIPWPLPATAGAEYFGAGKEDLPIVPQTLNTTFQGEYYARGGAIPASGSIPLVNIYSNEYKFNRGAHEREFKTASGMPSGRQ